MKQVWILNHYAIEPGTAGITRHFDLAVNLRKQGWQGTVIAASLEHSTGKQRLASDELHRHESYSNVPFLWIRTPRYKGNGVRRILNVLTYTFRVLMPVHTNRLPKPDVVLGSSAHPFAAMAGLLLARRHRVPFVFEVRDLWPQTLVDFGKLSEHGFTTWILRQLERLLYLHATRIVVLLPFAGDYIASLGISSKKVTWIPNGVEFSNFPAKTNATDRPSNAPFVLMYLGSHALTYGLDLILHAMKLISQQVPPGAIKLRMIGHGAMKEELMRLADELSLADVSFEPPVPKNEIPDLASQADAFLITQPETPVWSKYGISTNKLFDYLASARPVVIASNAANNPVHDAGAGIVVSPGDTEKFAQAILTLYRMSPQERQHLGDAGRRYVETHHNLDLLAARLATTLDECLVEAAHKKQAVVSTLRSTLPVSPPDK